MDIKEKELQQAYEQYLRQQKRESRNYLLLATAGMFSFLLIWQLLVQFEMIPTRNIASPTAVLQAFFYKLSNTAPDGNTLPYNLLTSMRISVTGYVLAVLIGVPLGLVMGWFKGAEWFIRPIFELIRPIPPVAWIPLIILWFGIGFKAKVVIIFFTTFVSCVINSYTGIRLTSSVHINVAKTFGASNLTTFFKVGIPSAMPMVLTGMRLALGTSWSTLVAAEMLAANAGLGFMIVMGRSFVRPDIIILGMLVIGGMGALMTGILSRVERRVLRYRINR